MPLLNHLWEAELTALLMDYYHNYIKQRKEASLNILEGVF